MNQIKTLNTIEQKALTEFSQKLSQKFGSRLVLIKLFGSKARGDFHAESDLDILVVVENLKQREKDFINNIEFNLFSKHQEIIINSMVFSADTWRTYQEKRFSLARNIEDEGINI